MREERKIVTTLPENSETPLESVRSWVTPNRLFFVRSHFPTPELRLEDFRLAVEGCVERPMSWTWEELMSLPEKTVFATVECAGNGRSFLTPHVHGVQWGAGAIGHAEWTGVPLKLVLEKCGVRADAKEALFEGWDRGTESDHPEEMAFERSLPLEKALHPDTLLAYRMNGEILEPIHGYPLRLFVPGWYGVASVKWLRRIRLVDRAFKGYYQSKKYTYQAAAQNGPETRIVAEMVVKSEIIRPAEGEAVGVGTTRIFGVAWGGEEAIERVEVSIDGGSSWSPAELVGIQAKYSWTMFEYLWEVAQPGDYTILARAFTSSGKGQPVEHDTLRSGYLINFPRPRKVKVAASQRSAAGWSDFETMVYDMNAFAEHNSRVRLDFELEFVGGEGI